MVQRIQTILIDDLDGGSAVETVRFSLDGTSYEIDLNENNAMLLRKDFENYVRVARKVGGKRKSTGSGHNPAEIRKWAREQGLDVPERGRIPKTVYRAFNNAASAA